MDTVDKGTKSEREFRLEAELEAACVLLAKAEGWTVRKVKFLGHNAAPDRLFGKRRAFLCEFKRRGQEPTPLQYIEHAQLRAIGLSVEWTDSFEGFKALLDAYS